MQNARLILKCVLFRGETEVELEIEREQGGSRQSAFHRCLPEHLGQSSKTQ